MNSRAIVWLAVAAMGAGAAMGCSIEDIGNCGNQVAALGEGGNGGSGGADGEGGAPDAGFPLSLKVPIECSKGTHSAPVGPAGSFTTFPLSLPLGSRLLSAETIVSSTAPPGDWLTVIGVSVKVQMIALAADVPNASPAPHKLEVMVAPAAGGMPIDPGKIYFGLIGGPPATVSGGWTCYVQLGDCEGQQNGVPCGLDGTCADGTCAEAESP